MAIQRVKMGVTVGGGAGERGGGNGGVFLLRKHTKSQSHIMENNLTEETSED